MKKGTVKRNGRKYAILSALRKGKGKKSESWIADFVLGRSTVSDEEKRRLTGITQGHMWDLVKLGMVERYMSKDFKKNEIVMYKITAFGVDTLKMTDSL